LDNEQKANTGAKVARLAVQPSKNVDSSLPKGDYESENYMTNVRSQEQQKDKIKLTFLGTAEKSTILLQ